MQISKIVTHPSFLFPQHTKTRLGNFNDMVTKIKCLNTKQCSFSMLCSVDFLPSSLT